MGITELLTFLVSARPKRASCELRQAGSHGRKGPFIVFAEVFLIPWAYSLPCSLPHTYPDCVSFHSIVCAANTALYANNVVHRCSGAGTTMLCEMLMLFSPPSSTLPLIFDCCLCYLFVIMPITRCSIKVSRWAWCQLMPVSLTRAIVEDWSLAVADG